MDKCCSIFDNGESLKITYDNDDEYILIKKGDSSIKLNLLMR